MKRRCRFAYPQSAHSSYFYYYCWYWRSSHDSDVEMRGLCSTFTHTSHYGWCQEGHLVKIASPCTSKASLCPDDRLFIQKPKVILAVIVAVANDNGYIGQFTKSNYCQSRWIDDEVMVYEVIIWFIEFDFFYVILLVRTLWILLVLQLTSAILSSIFYLTLSAFCPQISCK